MIALLNEIPAVEAEQALMTVERLQVGGGLLKRPDAQRILSGWQRLARPRGQEAQARTLGDLVGLFRGMRGVRILPSRRKEP